uniref:THO complex subunit 5 homolog B-like n=1 Tax=Hirondellea gigas TaxID=1518452 RepID=A0A6A7FQL2_9CRUS
MEENSNDTSSHKSRNRRGRSSNRKELVQAPGSSSSTPVAVAAAAAPATVDPIKQMLALHPLHVEVTVSTEEGSSVVIQFHYATELRLVTSRCVVLTKERPMIPGAVVLTDMLSGGDFLDCLFPDDSGVASPNPATIHQLRRYYTTHQCPPSNLPVGEAIIPAEIGRAYRWAQLLAGLAFPYSQQGEPAVQSALLAEMAQDMHAENKANSGPQSCTASGVSSERVHVTLSAIRRRLRSRLALQQHLLILQGATSTSSIPVPSECMSMLFPGKVCSELMSWRTITWREYSALASTAAIREAGLATDRCLYFRAVYQRKHVDMIAFACISPDYPQVVPLFALEMKWGEQLCPYAHIQQLEAEVNVHWSELVPGNTDRRHVLPLMLYRLAMCLDVYTEAASSRLVDADPSAAANDTHFHKEKIFFRPARGPDRAFPLRYLPKLRVFAQR